MSGGDLKIAVVGAGIIGTTTAGELQKLYRNARIDIIAEGFDNDTVSSVAVGLFRPGTSFMGPSEEITEKWMIDSYEYWENLRRSREGIKAGVIEISGYMFSNEFPVRNRFLEKVCPLYRPVTKEELTLCLGGWKYGSFLTTLLSQPSYFMPWAIENFKRAGGNIIKQRVEALESLSSNYDVIVNCTGLGAKALCNDHRLVSMRGQVIKVKAPWLKTFFYGDVETYVIPGIDSVTLGGCRQYESYDRTVNKYDGLKIKEQCEALVPSLRNAEVIEQKVGLRPHRDAVRVEKEIKNVSGRKVKIVHNYGHSGYGITTAPGTAIYACSLVQELLSGNSKL